MLKGYLLCRLFSEVDTSGDQRVDYKEFEAILHKMDRNLKSLPATAQVASQQVSHVIIML